MIHIKGFKAGYGYCGISGYTGTTPENFISAPKQTQCKICRIFLENDFDIKKSCKQLTYNQVRRFGAAGGNVGSNWRSLVGKEDKRRTDGILPPEFANEPWFHRVSRVVSPVTIMLDDDTVCIRWKNGKWVEIRAAY